MRPRLILTLVATLAGTLGFPQYCPPTAVSVCPWGCTKYESGYFDCCSTAKVSATDATFHSPPYCCQYSCYASVGCSGPFYCTPYGDDYGYIWMTGPNKLCQQPSGMCQI